LAYGGQRSGLDGSVDGGGRMAKRKQDDRQLSLPLGPPPKAAPDRALTESTAGVADAGLEAPQVRWQDPLPEWAHTDFPEPGAPLTIYLYPWDELEDAYDGDLLPADEIKRAVLLALLALGQASRRLRERAFTVYIGDLGPGMSLFGVGIGSQDGQLIEWLHSRLKVPGYRTYELGQNNHGSVHLPPWVRYDHGYLIRYVGPEEVGQVVVDDAVNGLGTGAVLHGRHAVDPRLVGLRKGAWGKLVRDGSIG